jgi:NitT/TauT family transport system permease protein
LRLLLRRLTNSNCRRIGPVSSNLVEPSVLADLPDGSRHAQNANGDTAFPAATAGGMALAALLVHFLVAEGRPQPPSWMDGIPDWRHPYPVLLVVLLAASVFALLAQAAWRPVRPRVRHYTPLAAGVISVLCLWEVVTAKRNWLQLPFFPGPDDVLGALIDDRRLLAVSALHSLRLLLCGYGAGVAVGLVYGVAIGWFRQARYWGSPVLRVLGPVPATVLVPTVMTVFPGSLSAAAALVGFAVWFPVTMLTATGIANVRRAYLDVARTLGAGQAYLIFRVALPSALPHVFMGLFIGLGAASLTLPVAETVGVSAGLGWYLKWQQGYAEYAKVYASLVIMAAFFSTAMALLFATRDRVLRWQKGEVRW